MTEQDDCVLDDFLLSDKSTLNNIAKNFAIASDLANEAANASNDFVCEVKNHQSFVVSYLIG